MTNIEATIVATTINDAFPDAKAHVYTPKHGNRGEFAVEFRESPEGAPFTNEKFVTSLSDFGFQFKELCAKRAYYGLMGRST